MVRISFVFLGVAVLFGPVSVRSQVSPVDPPELTAAERELREGRRALEEIVGPELVRAGRTLAREGLLSLDMAEDQPGELGVSDPTGPLLMAPVAR